LASERDLTKVTFAELEDGELMAIAKEAYRAINVIDCFGSSDVKRYIGARNELVKRGWTVTDGWNNRLYFKRPKTG